MGDQAAGLRNAGLQEEFIEEDFLKQVEEMFPAVELDWVKRQRRAQISRFQILNIISSPTTNSQVPKRIQQAKRLMSEELNQDSPVQAYMKGGGGASSYMRMADHYFHSSGEERTRELQKEGCFHEYMTATTDCLANNFPMLSIAGIREVAVDFKLLFAPSWKAIKDAQSRNVLVQKRDGKYLQVETEKGPARYLKMLKGKRGTRVVRMIPEALREEMELVKGCEEASSSSSSSSALPGSLRQPEVFECGICFNEVEMWRQVSCANGHTFCSECVRSHGKEAAYGQGKSALLECLELGCESGFWRGDLKCVLDRDTMRRLDERYREENLQLAQVENLERCKYCNYGVIVEVSKEVDKVFKCANCLAETCRCCGKDWDDAHIGRPCSQLNTDIKDRTRKELEEKLSEAVIRKCHKCGIPFEKMEGCNKMTCRCLATLCYICRTPDIDYTHFCRHPKNPEDTGCRECDKCLLFEDPKKKDTKKLAIIVDEARTDGIDPEILEQVAAKGQGGVMPRNALQREVVVGEDPDPWNLPPGLPRQEGQNREMAAGGPWIPGLVGVPQDHQAPFYIPFRPAPHGGRRVEVPELRNPPPRPPFPFHFQQRQEAERGGFVPRNNAEHNPRFPPVQHHHGFRPPPPRAPLLHNPHPPPIHRGPGIPPPRFNVGPWPQGQGRGFP